MKYKNIAAACACIFFTISPAITFADMVVIKYAEGSVVADKSQIAINVGPLYNARGTGIELLNPKGPVLIKRCKNTDFHPVFAAAFAEKLAKHLTENDQLDVDEFFGNC